MALRAPQAPGAAAGLAAALACLIACGCGKGGHVDSTATSATVHAAAPPASAGTLTAQRAKAFADAVNLQSADLPGFRASHTSRRSEGPAERKLQDGLAECIGARTPSARQQGGASLPERNSPEFSRRVSLITFTTSSSISFSRSPQAAASELATLRSPHTRACLQRYLLALLQTRHLGGVTFGRVKIAQGIPPALGTAGGFGWRVTAHAALNGISVPIYLDVLGFIYRTAEVRLQSTGLVAPFPGSAQEHLYRELIARAKSQKL